MKRFFLSIILLFLNPRLYANDLPKEIYGSYQFLSTAGRSVIGVLTITKDYVAYGNNYNGVCSDSFTVVRLLDKRNYPNNLLEVSRDNIFYQSYKLIMDNPSECDHILQISIKHLIEEPLETKTQFFLETPNKIKRIDLVTYKNGKFSGWMPNGIRVTENIGAFTKKIYERPTNCTA